MILRLVHSSLLAACAALLSLNLATAEEQSKPAQAIAPTSSPKPPIAIAAEGERVRPIIRKPITQDGRRNGLIASRLSGILAGHHFRQRPYDNDVSRMHLKYFLDALDPKRMIFLKSDVDEFNEKYGSLLDNATDRRDVSPAFTIYKVFLERLEQVLTRVKRLADMEHDFTVDEYYNPDRSELTHPADEAEADDLWRRRIKYELLAGKLNDDKPEETIKRIKKRYTNLLRLAWENDEQDVMNYYLDGLCAAYDPHSDYHTPREAENFKISAIDMQLSGIGVVLSTKEGYATIVQLITGGPADSDKTKNRLKPGERIIEVAQGDGEPVDIVDMKLDRVVELIRGRKGTKVRLTIVPPVDAPNAAVRREVVIVRDNVKLTDQYAKANIYEHVGPDGNKYKLGVLILPSFYEEVVDHSTRLLRKLMEEKVDGVIVDLRNNGGGLLDAAVDLTGLFVKTGPVVQIRDYRGLINTLSDMDRRILYKGPLVVLVGHLSASASEILAGALQDYDRAVVVGDKSTHGKGTVQSIVPLGRWMPGSFKGEPGQLKITVSKFYRVSGGSTQQKGVEPDIQLPSTLDYYEIGERHLPNCLEFDRVPAERFADYNMADPFIDKLRAKSQHRIENHPDFAYVLEDIELVKERLADKRVSLNYDTRVKEKEELEAKAEARKKERKDRLAKVKDKEKIFEVTIDMLNNKEPLREVTDKKEKTPQELIAEVTSDKPKDDDDEEKEEDEEPFDPHMDETLNILADYIMLERGGADYLTTENKTDGKADSEPSSPTALSATPAQAADAQQ